MTNDEIPNDENGPENEELNRQQVEWSADGTSVRHSTFVDVFVVGYLVIQAKIAPSGSVIWDPDPWIVSGFNDAHKG